MKKLLLAILFMATLCVAIWRTEHETWLGIWLLGLIFVALPVLLLAIRDAIASVGSNRLRHGPLLLHTCAVFAALLGYFVGWMAVDSEHPKADSHQWMAIVFPLFVYATPLLMIFHGLPPSKLKYFYIGGRDDDGA